MKNFQLAFAVQMAHELRLGQPLQRIFVLGSLQAQNDGIYFANVDWK